MHYLLVVLFFIIYTPQVWAVTYNYKAYIVFPQTGEEIYFDVVHNLDIGTGKVTGRTAKGAICKGTARPTSIPTNAFCIGQTGEAQIACTGGRQIVVSLLLENCTQGVGIGASSDKSDNEVLLSFGGLPQTLKQRAVAFGKQIQADVATPTGATGTGFFVSNDGGVVTNYHVIDGMRTVKIYDPKHNSWADAKVLGVDKANDVALLRAERPGNALPLAAKFSVKKGEQIFVLGYPRPGVQGTQQKATFGQVNSVMGEKDDIRFFQMDVPIQPGNSGGPVFNEVGEVVGIATSGLRGEYQNVNYALKLDYMFPLLAEALPDLSKVKPESGTFPQLVERYEDSVVMIVAEQ